MAMLPIQETNNGVVFHIRVLPRSSRCEIVGVQDNALKVKITAPPVEGKANAACIRFLSDVLGVRKNRITIKAGQKSKNKTVSISGITKEEVLSAIPLSQ